MLGKKSQGLEIISNMSEIMDSDSFKDHFTKTAQVSELKTTVVPGPSTGKVVPPKNVDDELKNLRVELNVDDQGNQRTLEDKNKDQGVQQAISAILSRADKTKPVQETNPSEVSLLKNFVASKERYAKEVPSIVAAKTASTIVDELVKIANFLGEEEMFTSEAMVDTLIESIVAEAGKKKQLKKLMKKMEKAKAAKKDKECEEECKEEKDEE